MGAKTVSVVGGFTMLLIKWFLGDRVKIEPNFRTNPTNFIVGIITIIIVTFFGIVIYGMIDEGLAFNEVF